MEFVLDENEIYSGKVVYFKPAQGFGFIRPECDVGGDVYVHFTEIEKSLKGFKNLVAGDIVTFKLRENGINPRTNLTNYKAIDLEIVRSLGAR